MIRLIFLCMFTVFALPAWAACSNPTANAGAMDWKGSKFQYCDGTSWQDFGGAGAVNDLSDVSATTPISGSVLLFDGTEWESITLATLKTLLDSGAGGGSSGPPDCPNVNDVCSDGTIYAGLSPDGDKKMYTTRCDYGQTWNGSSCTGSRNSVEWGNYGTDLGGLANCQSEYGTATPTDTSAACVGGKANSTYLASQNSPAAQACENLSAHGHDDWYLPAVNELWRFHNSGSPLSNLQTDGSWYWSSSENDLNTARVVRFSDGNRYNYNKTYHISVRCARR